MRQSAGRSDHRAAQDDRQHEPPVPVVDLVTGKCKPGKVSMTPLTLDLTVVCTSGVKVPPPGVSAQVVLPLATVASTVTAIGTNTPVVAIPAPVVEQPDCSPHLPRLRCYGEQRRTRRRPIGPTVFRRGTLRKFRTRAVSSMCHRFHQDSSFGLHEGAGRLRLERSYCRQR